MKKFLIFTVVMLLALLPRSVMAYDFMVDGLAYNINSDGTSVTVTYENTTSPRHSNLSSEVNIPETVTNNSKTFSVTAIGDYAFYGDVLTSITIPNTITTIGYAGFAYCTGLTSMTIGNSVKNIGDYAYYKCSGLTSITIPNSVTSIGNRAFYNSSNLKTISFLNSDINVGAEAFHNTQWYENQPEGMIYIGLDAYSYKGNMTNWPTYITIKDGTKYITDKCFENKITNNIAPFDCLYSVTFPNSLISIGSDAFNYCINLTNITIPNSVTFIGGNAFDGTSWYWNQPDGLVYAGLVAYKYKGEMPEGTSIEINDGTVSISPYCFDNSGYYDNKRLTSVTIPNTVTTIGDYAFRESDITNISIPNSVVTIGKNAFYGCVKLENATIGNEVQIIGNRAFGDCWKLKNINIPSSVTSISSGAFMGCELESIVVESGNTKYDSRNNCNAIIVTATNTIHTGCKNTIIPNTVSTIGNSAFSYSGLTNITIPNSVTKIDDSAFSWSGLTNITIPNSVTSIGDKAFQSCQYLTSLIIPSSITKISNAAFIQCYGLTSITLPNSITVIDSQAFAYCNSLTDISIPNSVTTIGDIAFNQCTSLSNITIPNSVNTIGGLAFGDTPWYNNQPDGLIYAGLVAYKYKGTMPDDTSIRIKDGTISISPSCFDNYYENYNGLTSVYIPSSLRVIGNYAFEGCDNIKHLSWNAKNCESNGNMPTSNIETITIGNKVETLPSYFASSSKITEAIIPNSVTKINEHAFDGCDSLKTLYLGTNLEDIGAYAFNCSNLSAIYNARQRPAVIEASVFENVDKNTCWLYVPEGFEQVYWANADWNRFKHIGTWDPASMGQITGDATGDSTIDVEDVNAAINIILKLKNISDYPGSCDMDGNGIIDVEDVNAMINIILKL